MGEEQEERSRKPKKNKKREGRRAMARAENRCVLSPVGPT